MSDATPTKPHQYDGVNISGTMMTPIEVPKWAEEIP